MVKRIFFFVIAIFFAIAIYYLNYQSDKYEYTLELATNAIEEERYSDVVRVFSGLFDNRSLITEEDEDVILKVYPGTEQTQVLYYSGSNQQRYVNYEKSYYFYLFNLDFNYNTYSVNEVDNNKSGIKFISEDNEYDYYLINNEKINSNTYSEKPTTPALALLKGERNLFSTLEKANFININFSEKMLTEIVSKIGEINKVGIMDAEGNLVCCYDIKLNFTNDFFVDNEQMINKYSETLIKYQNTSDKSKKEQVTNEFSKYYEEWYEEFMATNNPNYSFGYDSKTLAPFKLYFKSIWSMIIYFIIVSLLYVIIFHRKQLVNLARKLAGKPVEKLKPIGEYKIEDDKIDVDNPKKEVKLEKK